MDEMRRLVDKYSKSQNDSHGGSHVKTAEEPSTRPGSLVETNVEENKGASAQGLAPKAVLQECSGNLR